MKKYEIAIMETLKSLGASKTYVGYDYVLFGLILLFQDKRKITGIVKSLYIEIADYYETTWNCVEKNIRWLVKQIWTKIMTVYYIKFLIKLQRISELQTKNFSEICMNISRIHTKSMKLYLQD